VTAYSLPTVDYTVIISFTFDAIHRSSWTSEEMVSAKSSEVSAPQTFLIAKYNYGILTFICRQPTQSPIAALLAPIAW